jgi:hypothetical protein
MDEGISKLLAGRLNEPPDKRAAQGLAHCWWGPAEAGAAGDRGSCECSVGATPAWHRPCLV